MADKKIIVVIGATGQQGGGLARAIPNVVEEIRQAHGQEPFTLVFDRGGYSGKAFRFLEEQGVGFITYLKGRKARRRPGEYLAWSQ